MNTHLYLDGFSLSSWLQEADFSFSFLAFWPCLSEPGDYNLSPSCENTVGQTISLSLALFLFFLSLSFSLTHTRARTNREARSSAQILVKLAAGLQVNPKTLEIRPCICLNVFFSLLKLFPELNVRFWGRKMILSYLHTFYVLLRLQYVCILLQASMSNTCLQYRG